MTYRIVPRTEIGLPAEVRSSSGYLRPPLALERWMTAHYTGVYVKYADRDTPDTILNIQRVFANSKPFEYNYVIGQENDEAIYEFAGKFQAAHSGGENGDSFGVLFLLGVGEELTVKMMDKWRWLRDVLIADGSLRTDVEQLKHKDMPGAATACPGLSITARWNEMLRPWRKPAPTEGVSMYPKAIRLAGQPGAYAQWAGFKAWLPTPSSRDAFLFAHGVQLETLTSVDLFVAAGPIVGPRPSGFDRWGVKE